MQRIIDLSQVLDKSMVVYPGDPSFFVEKFKCFNKDKYQACCFQMSCHGGTHADAPSHFVCGGKDIDEIALDNFIGKAFVTDAVILDGMISTKALKSSLTAKGDEKILILRTGWEVFVGTDSYYTDHPFFERRISSILKEAGICTIAVDMPSLTNKSGTIDMHLDLLENNITIIESLINLKSISKNKIFFSAAPLKIKGCDAAPVRAYAIEDYE